MTDTLATEALVPLTVEQIEAAKLAYAAVPFSPLVPAKPTGKQMAFLANMGKEALYGGTARSMKSWAALMAASQFACVPGYAAIIFRRTLKSLELPDGLIEISHSWFDGKAKWSEEKNRWTFPSGATLSFGYLEDHKDLMRYHSSAYQFILFEEIAEWPTDAEYTYMFSRVTPKVDADGNLPRCQCHNWSVADVPSRIRATANPGGPGQGWVRSRFILPWRAGVPGLFHPASYKDNPYIDHVEYEETTSRMRKIDRDRVLGGDWDITAPGERFSRAWFKPMRAEQFKTLLESGQLRGVRRWDMAGTKVKKTNKDPDFTASAAVFLRNTPDGEQWIIAHIDQFRDTSGSVIARMKRRSKVDDKRYGRHLPIRVEREPGTQARHAMSLVKQEHFKGYNFRAVYSRINKEDRIDVLAVNAEAGSDNQGEAGVWYLDDMPNAQEMLDQAEAYGNPGVHDDILDAIAGAMHDLSRGGGVKAGARSADRAAAAAEQSEEGGYPAFTRAPRGMGGYDEVLAAINGVEQPPAPDLRPTADRKLALLGAIRR